MLNKMKFLLIALLFSAGSASAATINVLWYSGGVSSTAGACTPSNYKGCITDSLVPQAAANTVMNDWNVTFWDGGAVPAGSFDVLVTASQAGSWSSYPDYTALTTAMGSGDVSFGDRLMVSGQDADWHYMNSTGHSSDSNFDSSQGFLIDAINWAGSGSGLGLVALDADPVFGALAGLGTMQVNHGDSVLIPAGSATFPINEGLTSEGLSDWGSSHHRTWTGWDTSVWDAINVSADCSGVVYTDCAVTLVSAATADAPTTPTDVPEPGILGLLGLGLMGLVLRRRTRTA